MLQKEKQKATALIRTQEFCEKAKKKHLKSTPKILQKQENGTKTTIISLACVYQTK